MRVKMCAETKELFKGWCEQKGFGTGGMKRAIVIAIQRRTELRQYAEFSFARREGEAVLAVDINPDLFRDFERWCEYEAVSMSSVIRGWIDHRDQIAPYIVPRTDSLEAELHKAHEVIKEAERICNY